MFRNIFAISDIELGQGDIFDDFKDEALLLKFLRKITAEPGKNTLVLNGDTFDFMKMPYQDKFTHHVTEEISLWKMQRIFDTYPKIFQALSDFLNKKANKIHFNIGNHDYDLLWPEVQKMLKKKLGNPNKITFAFTFDNKEVHIEHGNQVDYFHKMDEKKPFIKYRGTKLLNLPLGSVAVIKYFIELKKEFPYQERIYPRHSAFETYPEFKKTKQRISRNFILRGLLFNFIVNIGDPVSNVPYINLIRHIFFHGLEVHDEQKFLKKRFKNIVKLYPDKKAYIMGHVHLTYHELTPNKDHVEIVTDTWREEYRMTSNHEELLKPRTYAHIRYEDDKLKTIDLLNFA
ncbi:metallophosphoesterase [Candidatus Peregrinibacteria bacterium]|nr:metallophosphoesterase [Candidatus Peregrinibacteria bacterium]